MQLVEQLEPSLCRLKVGKELFTRCGPALVKQLVDKNFDVFLDLKYHDIPNTVARACEAAADLGVWMLNVHALGGEKMMQAARQAMSSARRSVTDSGNMADQQRSGRTGCAWYTVDPGSDGIKTGKHDKKCRP